MVPHLSSKGEVEAASLVAALAFKRVGSVEHVFGQPPSIAFLFSFDHGELLVCLLTTTNMLDDGSHLSN